MLSFSSVRPLALVFSLCIERREKKQKKRSKAEKVIAVVNRLFASNTAFCSPGKLQNHRIEFHFSRRVNVRDLTQSGWEKAQRGRGEAWEGGGGDEKETKAKAKGRGITRLCR